MVFLRILPLALLAGLVLLALPATAIPNRQACSLRVDPLTGMGERSCQQATSSGPIALPSYQVTKPSQAIAWLNKHQPMEKKPSIIVEQVQTPPEKDAMPGRRKEASVGLSQRLCASGRTPYSGLNPNPEGHVSRIISCLPAGAVIGQESASFLPRRVQLARWRALRDPYLYTQKHNRPLQAR